MSLCENESRFSREGRQRLLKIVSTRIGELAAEMGFSAGRIATRDFRAERDGQRITRLLTD
jgi:hypothetical protein